MPQGTGTYGEHVVSPLKKQNYQSGGAVDPFSLENPSSVSSVIEREMMEGETSEYPTLNAQERSQIFQLGGAVRPPTSPSITPSAYEKGGKVK